MNVVILNSHLWHNRASICDQEDARYFPDKSGSLKMGVCLKVTLSFGFLRIPPFSKSIRSWFATICLRFPFFSRPHVCGVCPLSLVYWPSTPGYPRSVVLEGRSVRDKSRVWSWACFSPSTSRTLGMPCAPYSSPVRWSERQCYWFRQTKPTTKPKWQVAYFFFINQRVPSNVHDRNVAQIWLWRFSKCDVQDFNSESVCFGKEPLTFGANVLVSLFTTHAGSLPAKDRNIFLSAHHALRYLGAPLCTTSIGWSSWSCILQGRCVLGTQWMYCKLGVPQFDYALLGTNEDLWGTAQWKGISAPQSYILAKRRSVWEH